MIVISAALIACGRHPVFRQKRVGYRQAEFMILKFRTLSPGRCATAPLGQSSWLQRAQDRAFAGLSHLLRQSRLDELLQLVNIVKGDMAFIGPRPLIPSDVTDAKPRGPDASTYDRVYRTGPSQWRSGAAAGGEAAA